MSNVKNASRLEVAKAVAESDRKQIKGDAFGKFAAASSSWLGSRWAFVGAIVIIGVWAATGRLFHYSDTWQLVINTGTTIITFLMVSLFKTLKIAMPARSISSLTSSSTRSTRRETR